MRGVIKRILAIDGRVTLNSFSHEQSLHVLELSRINQLEMLNQLSKAFTITRLCHIVILIAEIRQLHSDHIQVWIGYGLG